MAIHLILSLFFLLGAGFITALIRSLELLGRIQSKKEFHQKKHFYFFYFLIKRIFPKDKWENVFFLLSITKNILQLLYATFFFYYLSNFIQKDSISLILSIVIIVGLSLFIDFLSRLIVEFHPLLHLKITTLLTTFFLILFSPITFSFLKIKKIFLYSDTSPSLIATHAKVKDKILELVLESELSSMLEPSDKRLISSIASFRDRIVREIMVPRIDVFTLSLHQTLHEAAQKFISEGYSRIPIYEDSVDNIVGVLLYKDVIAYYFHSFEKKELSPLETPLKKLIKPVLYAPETKKISYLLQEFRNKQIHLAIVVDEYGGTEGIVTIEDILEELVGEIADEYDVIEEEQLYTPFSEGGWVIDGKMSIVDIEKHLGIVIPHSPEYDTIGGYVFHRAGAIPSKGWKIHHDNFDLEIQSTNERSIEKVIITPSQS